MSTPRTDAAIAKFFDSVNKRGKAADYESLFDTARQLETELNAKNAEGSREVSDGGNDADKAETPGALDASKTTQSVDLQPEHGGAERAHILTNRFGIPFVMEGDRVITKCPNLADAERIVRALNAEGSREVVGNVNQGVAVTAETELRELATLRPITPEDITAEANRSYDLGRKHGIGECQDELEDLRAKISALQAREQKLVEALKADKEQLDWLERNAAHKNDLAIQWDYEDGYWLREIDRGQSGKTLDFHSKPAKGLREAISRAIAEQQK